MAHHIMMKKTTIYLGDRELRALKVLATKMVGGNAATLIRQAVSDFLRKKKQKNTFTFFKKILHQKPSHTSFGDPVEYQRLLRKEWS